MTNLDEQGLHRLMKAALDNGTASSLAEAEAIFKGYTLSIAFDARVATDPAYQAALLTSVALARRVFLGGVRVSGAVDVPLAPNMPFGGTITEAIVKLGAAITDEVTSDHPIISITDRATARQGDFHIRPAFAGWRGGVVPIDFEFSSSSAMPLSPMLAAGLAINEAFTFVADRDPIAGRRAIGISLWDSDRDWLVEDDGPDLVLLPSRLWLIGLGHLGQAYLWALSLLPYRHDGLELVLQDTDVITKSTESTSILSDSTMIGMKKTRVLATWAEARGFKTSIHERLFDASFRLQPDEPVVALCGVDNVPARRAFDNAGFSLVVEAGLGQGHQDFRSIRLHTLPTSKAASEIWRAASAREDVSTRPAYQEMLRAGVVDRCGMTTLAGKAVGAPFVGAVAATLVVSQLLRHLNGGTMDALVDLDLRSAEHRHTVPQRHDFQSVNPGYVQVVQEPRDA